MTRPKICVYAISLNEEQFVQRFVESCRDADCIIVADTGSMDKTVEKLEELGVIVYKISVKPFRFDTARNIALGLVPHDIDMCISMDMDEILTPGWRKQLDTTWMQTKTKPSGISYKYIWSWNSDNTPCIYFNTEKIHARHGYNWRYPCHEALSWTLEEAETRLFCPLEIHHYPDNTKSRTQYLDILKMGIREYPWSARPAYYYARELFFNNKYNESIIEFERYLSLSDANYTHERAAALVFCMQASMNLLRSYEICLNYLTRSNLEVENGNAYMWMARLSYQCSRWAECSDYCNKAIDNKEDTAFSSCPEINSSLPYDYLSICSWHLNLYADAVKWVKIALEYEPDNLRLKDNLIVYQVKCN